MPVHPKTGKPIPAASLANLAKPWPKGVSGNPGGLPGTDVAAQAAREFFARHPTITAATVRELRGFNAYGWAQLADRAFGKLVEKAQVMTTGVSLEDVLRARKKVEAAKEEMARRLGRSKDTPPDPVSDDTVPDKTQDV